MDLSGCWVFLSRRLLARCSHLNADSFLDNSIHVRSLWADANRIARIEIALFLRNPSGEDGNLGGAGRNHPNVSELCGIEPIGVVEPASAETVLPGLTSEKRRLNQGFSVEIAHTNFGGWSIEVGDIDVSAFGQVAVDRQEATRMLLDRQFCVRRDRLREAPAPSRRSARERVSRSQRAT